ncbi:universal stress protein [Streptomyces thermovulgaris]|uniref:universal stress protein n=1 Tax=Streptomyces thermovulgaris TaxID=1934 RepID=UPI001FE53A20|nr:universal stress protein [Streptomyces thermovulgaris]
MTVDQGIGSVTAGVDGSRAGQDAAAWAAREARRRKLPLRLLHAGTDSVPERAAEELACAYPQVEITVIRARSPAAKALLTASSGTGLLVLGTRGFTGFAGFPVGSVALAAAARASCPVVLVRSGERPEDERDAVPGTPPDEAPYLPVVLGVDLERPAGALVGQAFCTAAVRPAPLHVVHTWTPLCPDRGAPAGPACCAETAAEEDTRRHLLAVWLRPWRRRFPGTAVETEVVPGRPVQQLLRTCARAGLLVVGRRSGSGRGLGEVAHSLIHHATCPVAVVPYD